MCWLGVRGRIVTLLFIKILPARRSGPRLATLLLQVLSVAVAPLALGGAPTGFGSASS